MKSLTLCKSGLNPSPNSRGIRLSRLAILLNLSTLLAIISLEIRPPVLLGNCVSLTRNSELGSGCCTWNWATGACCSGAGSDFSCWLLLFKKKSSKLRRRSAIGVIWFSVWITFPDPSGIWIENVFSLAATS